MTDRRGQRYVWRTALRAPDALFAALPRLHRAHVQVLHARGLTAAEQCQDFLDGICRDPDDPLLLADMPRAVERLLQARERGEQVAVFTDYDADGINAAAVLATGLRQIGIDPIVRLPNRFTDGYGLTSVAVCELAQRGATVIVTADCGSTAHEAALEARARGVDLVITDHHQCPAELPLAYALVNPWRPDCTYPSDDLCGAGVAYKLVQALADAVLPEGRAAMDPLLDLVAVATVADIMRIVGENRRLVSAGLKILNTNPRPGLRALALSAGLQPGEIDVASLGFRLAPRVNAAGRLDDPSVAYHLLMAPTYEDAVPLAAELERLNVERQRLSREVERDALALVAGQVAAGAHGLVCGVEGWPQGLVGLVAGRVARAHNRPALVYTVFDGLATGSGRSIPGFDLLAALHTCGDLFDRYGGHQAAAGFSLPSERLPELAERFASAVRATLPPEALEPVLVVDGYLNPETVTFDFARGLEQLGPFGAGWRDPVFAMRNLRVSSSRALGDHGQHWRAWLRPLAGGIPLEAIAFDAGSWPVDLPAGTVLDAAFKLRRRQFNGKWNVELELLDVLPSGAPSS